MCFSIYFSQNQCDRIILNSYTEKIQDISQPSDVLTSSRWQKQVSYYICQLKMNTFCIFNPNYKIICMAPFHKTIKLKVAQYLELSIEEALTSKDVYSAFKHNFENVGKSFREQNLNNSYLKLEGGHWWNDEKRITVVSGHIPAVLLIPKNPWLWNSII